MAKNPLQRDIKGFNNRLKYTTSKPRLQNTLDSYKTRLASQGYDVEKLTDKRNWLEKALNLEQDQNALFDIFEIIGRPQQALFGGIKAAQEGKDVLKGAKEGLTGEKDTQFKDILTEAGMSDRKGKLDVSDVLGFAGDVLLDPMDIPLFGMGKVAKAVKAGDKLKDAMKLADSGSSLLFKGAGKAIKGTAKLGDKAFAKGLKVLDAADVRRATKLAQKTGDSVDNILAQVGKTATGRVDFYKGLKSDLRGIVDSNSLVKGLMGKSREADTAAAFAKDVAQKKAMAAESKLRKFTDNLAAQQNRNADEVFNEVSKGIYHLIESEQDTSIDAVRFFRGLTNKATDSNVFKATKDSVDELSRFFDKHGIKYKINKQGDRLVVLPKQMRDLKYFKNNPKLIDELGKLNLHKDLGYNEQNLEYLNDFKNFVKANPELSDFYKDAKNLIKDLNVNIKDITGVDYTPITNREGYITRTANKMNKAETAPAVTTVYGKGSDLDVWANKQGESTLALNTKYEDAYQRKGKSFDMKEANLKSQLYENQVKETKREILDLKKRKKAIGETYQANLEKIHKQSNTAKDSIEKATRIINDSEESLKGFTKNQIDKIEDRALQESVSKNKVAYNEAKKYQESLINRLQDKTLTDKEVKILEKEFDKSARKLEAAQTALNKSINDVENYTINKALEITKSSDNAMKATQKAAKQTAEFKANLANPKISKSKLTQSIDGAEKARQKAVSKLDNNVLNKLNQVKNKSLKTNVTGNIKEINKLTKNCEDVLKRLSKNTLTDKEITTLEKQLDKATKSFEKASIKLDGNLAAIRGYADKQTEQLLKKQESVLNKVKQQTTKIARNDNKIEQLAETERLINESYATNLSKIDSDIKRLQDKLGGLNPENDKFILKQIEDNAYARSIWESNAGKTAYETSFFTNINTFIDKATDYSRDAKIYNEAINLGVFSNDDFVKLARTVEGDVPKGFTKISGDVLAENLDRFKDFLPENSSKMKDIASRFKGQVLYVDDNFATILKMSKDTGKQTHAFVNLIDKVNNTFKRFKTFTLGSQMRNAIGSLVNMYLSGMPVHKIPEYGARAAVVMNNAENLSRKFAQGVAFTVEESKQWKYLTEFYKAGFTEKGFEAVQDLENIRDSLGKGGNLLKRGLDKATDFNLKLNNLVDSYNRMSLFMYAMDNPGYLKKLGKANAADAVRYTLFDPSNLSDLEKSGLKKLIPFYTFTKQNLYFQATNLMKNTPKYSRLIKSINSIYNQLDDDSYYKYQKENMQIPLPWTDSNGNQLFLKSNLPLSDLGEYLSNPVGRTVSSLTPAIKTPIEMVMGKDIFTGQDISDESKVEQIIGGLGLDNLTYGMRNKVESIIKRYNGDINNNEMWAEVFRSVLQNVNQEKVQNSKLYEEMESYQNIINELESQGIDIPTIREINASNKIKLNRVGKKRSNNRRFN